MRSIQKGQEPSSLLTYRCSPGANYDDFPKSELRASLIAEQRGLCCYCLSRIPGIRGMKIDHWHSQWEYPGEQLDYSNLLGACKGNEGQFVKSQHCDTRKGNRKLSRNPANANHRVDELIKYYADGRIASSDMDFDQELNKILNLNEARLKSNRRSTLDAFLLTIQRTGPLDKGILERWLRRWNGESSAGDLEPFCQVVVYWLRKRLARQ